MIRCILLKIRQLEKTDFILSSEYIVYLSVNATRGAKVGGGGGGLGDRNPPAIFGR